MSKVTFKRTWEEPTPDEEDARVEEEFRFDPKQWERLPRGVKKVRVNIYLDDDVVAYFKARAAQPHAAPYQTQINQTLREAMQRDSAPQAQASGAAELRAVLLKDKEFIEALAERIGKVQQPRKGKRRQAAREG
jgi:uncharacterized protein (DUF4415 family)